MTKISAEGELVIKEAERRFVKRIKFAASIFGIANLGALVAIFFGAKSAAEATVSAQITSSTTILQEAVSDGLSQIGNVREQYGAAQAEVETFRANITALRESLRTIESRDNVEAVASIIEALGESTDIEDILRRLTVLEGLRTIADGTIILIDQRQECPAGSSRIANLGLLTLRDMNYMSRDMVDATLDATVNSTRDDTPTWDRRQFRACIFN